MPRQSLMLLLALDEAFAEGERFAAKLEFAHVLPAHHYIHPFTAGVSTERLPMVSHS
jgi:hypothetical protein